MLLTTDANESLKISLILQKPFKFRLYPDESKHRPCCIPGYVFKFDHFG